MAITWNESLSNELKALKASKNLTPKQKQRISTLQGIKTASGGVVKGQKAAATDNSANLGVNKDGTIDGPVATDTLTTAVKDDAKATFDSFNPTSEVDPFGNTKTVTRDPITGEVKTSITQGEPAKAFTTAAMSAVGGYKPVDLSGAPIVSGGTAEDRRRAEDAAYGVLTRYTDRDRGRDLEDAKQEMANRGIPYDPAAANDPNATSLYGKTIGAINQKYQGEKDQASLRAATMGNDFMLASTSASKTANDAFVGAALGKSNADLSGISTMTGAAGQFSGSQTTGVQGVGTNTADPLLALTQLYQSGQISLADFNLKKQALAKSGSPGRSGGTPRAGDNSPTISGGLPPGFGIA